MKILFFSPHAATWDAASAEALIAEALSKSGHDVTMVTCNGFLGAYCISMAARGLRHEASEVEKKKVCELCRGHKSLIKSNFKFEIVDAENFLSTDDYTRLQKIKSGVTRKNFLDFQWEDLPVGKYALYEVLVHNKKSTYDLNEKEWAHYSDSLLNVLYSQRVAQKVFDQVKPERFLVFSSMYSMNHVWKKIAEQRGVIPYQIQGPPSVSDIGVRFTLARDDAKNGISFYSDAVQRWSEVSSKPCSQKGVQKITDHFRHLFRAGSFVYSPKFKGRNVREYFNIPKEAPLFTATLGSYDEIIAADTVGYPVLAKDGIFNSQQEWLKNLIEYFKKRPEWHLIIRPHPRMFPVMRSVVLSDEARSILHLLESLPSHIHVNMPSDDLSMYEVAQETDVVLNSWSTVGTEVALLGIPVVQYVSLTWIPSDLYDLGRTKAEYFSALESAILRKPGLARSKMAYRWLNLLFTVGTIDFSSAFFLRGQTWYKKLFRRLAVPSLSFKFFLKERFSAEIFERAELRYAKLEESQIQMINQIVCGNQSSVIQYALESMKWDSLSEMEESKAILSSLSAIFMKKHKRGESRFVRNLKLMLKEF